MDLIGSIVIACYIFFMEYIHLKESTFVLLEAVRNFQLSIKIKAFIESNFQVEVSNILLIPLSNLILYQ